MIKTRMLRHDEWPMVAPIVRNVFEDGMPVSPEQSGYLAAFAGETLAGFVNVEEVFHINNLYVAEGYRGTGLERRLALEVNEILSLVPGRSAIVLTDERAIGRALLRMGAQDRGVWRLFRKDFR
jgi:ribosomal protein S18 acetylase RimI-like enzyme